MKTACLLVGMVVCMNVCGQQSREALKAEVDAYVKTVGEAAARFLDKERSAAERVKAIEPHVVIYEERHVEGFKAVVLDDKEPPEVRAAALRRIVTHVPGDDRVGEVALAWLLNPEAPIALREEALRAEANLSFSSGSVPDAYQKLLEDPEVSFRVFGFTRLVAHGDARAQKLLIRGLENPDDAPLSAPTAIGILSMAPKKEFYPALFQLLQRTKDEATRLEAIRALGHYKEARERLMAISRDSAEKEPFREAALGALYSGDRDNIVQYVSPLLGDRTTSARLKAIGIQMSIDVRQRMTYRSQAKGADEFDRLVRTIAEEASVASEDASTRALQSVAAKYVETVRPKY